MPLLESCVLCGVGCTARPLHDPQHAAVCRDPSDALTVNRTCELDMYTFMHCKIVKARVDAVLHITGCPKPTRHNVSSSMVGVAVGRAVEVSLLRRLIRKTARSQASWACRKLVLTEILGAGCGGQHRGVDFCDFSSGSSHCTSSPDSAACHSACKQVQAQFRCLEGRHFRMPCPWRHHHPSPGLHPSPEWPWCQLSRHDLLRCVPAFAAAPVIPLLLYTHTPAVSVMGSA